MTFIKKKKKNFWGGENIRDKLVPNPHLSHKETEEERENIICFQHHWLLVKKLGLEPTDLASENMHVSGFFTQHCVQLEEGILKRENYRVSCDPPLPSSPASLPADRTLLFPSTWTFLVIPPTHSFPDGLAFPLSRKLFSWSFLSSQFKPLLKCRPKRGLLYQN